MVGLVASAGGLGAVSQILTGLTTGFDAAVVVLIHQEPERASRLAELLARRAALPVVAAEHGAWLGAGRVMVVPSGQHALIAPGGRIVLIASGAFPPSRPSADLLLVTLATAIGSRAIAVILSGGGHDGATGATALHACGGTVVATDQASSESFSMPLAAIRREDAVDHIVALADVAQLLTELTAARG